MREVRYCEVAHFHFYIPLLNLLSYRMLLLRQRFKMG